MKRILLIDNSRPTKNGGIGGSINSMLQLIARINKSKFKIYVLLYYKLPLLEDQLRKIEVTMIYKNNSLPRRINNLKQKTKNNIMRFVPFYSDLHIIKNINQVKYISTIIKQYEIDVVHGNNRISANTLCLLAAKKCNVPYIQHQRKFETKLGIVSKLNKNYPAFYFSISKSISNNINKVININNQKLQLIHNWINQQYNNNNNNNNNVFNILWIGRIVPWKGIDVLINIAKEMQESNFGLFEIDIYGDYVNIEYQNEVSNLIRKYHLDNKIKFRGFKNFHKIESSKYNVYIHTSKKPEPFGRTIIESMNFGIPVCATSMGGVLDIINHMENGILYHHKDYQKLIPLLIKLKSNIDFKNKLISNAKETIDEKFSGNFQIKLIEEVYERI